MSEIRVWHELRSKMKLNLNVFVSSLLLLAIAGALLYPWQRHVQAPAVMQAQNVAAIYAPRSGRLAHLDISTGKSVQKGDVLFTLRSDELEFERAVAEVKARRFRTALTRQSEDDFLEQRELLHEKLTEARTSIEGLDERSASLTVTAPFDGEITSVSDQLVRSEWVAKDIPLAMLVDRQRPQIVAYVDEVELGRVLEASQAVFYPEDPAIDPLALNIVEVGTSRVESLHEPALAAPHGGGIAVREDSPMAPVKSVFPIHLVPTGHTDVRLTRAVVRGTVHIEAESLSVLESSARHVIGVLRRESGF